MNIVDVGARFHFGVADQIFSPLNPKIMIIRGLAETMDMVKKADLVCFGGGEDIHPELYGHRNVCSAVDRKPSWRDLFEQAVFKTAVAREIPILGICRGAQLSCALSGGWLIQDVGGHGRVHELKTATGQKGIDMTSAHHQMMYPYDTKHNLIAWTENLSRNYTWDTERTKDVVIQQEPEIVFFPDTRALAIQGHPEYFEATHPTNDYVRSLVKKFLIPNLEI